MFAGFKSRFRKSAPLAPHLALGALGERVALEYLKEEGYEIVATNYRLPLGRSSNGQKLTGEIDIIAYDEETLVFVEVKTRTSDDIAAPERAVDLRKQRQIARAAYRYRKMLQISETPHRYDVVTVIPQAGNNRIELFKAYFDDSVFLRGRFFNQE